VVLLDHGTRLFGSIEHGVVNGLDWVFVLWQNALTPSGLKITLNSPAADEVGRGGIEGELDRKLDACYAFQRQGSRASILLIG
jgi:type IV secretion system protein VirB10